MAGSTSRARWIAALAAVAAVGAGSWLLLQEGPEIEDVVQPESLGEAPPAAPTGEATGGPDHAAGPGADLPKQRIASGGRLAIDADALPDDAPLVLALDLEDAARATGDHAVRLVSEDGRRVDLVAAPLPGGGSGVRLEIDPAFLSPGAYMIEIETAETHPLRIRRYVLEVR